MCRREIAPIELRVYHSCVQGRYSITPDIFSSSPENYNGYRSYVEDDESIHIDPRFVGSIEGDYRLRPDSPCVDAGLDDSSVRVSDADVDGNTRRADGDNDGTARIDMGAYEAIPVSSPVVVASPQGVTFHVYDAEPLAQPQSLAISNRGQGELQWTIDCDCPWLHVRPTAGGAGQNVELKVDGTGLAPGTYECELLIHEPFVVNGPFRVPVRLRVGRTLRVPGAFATLRAAVDATQSGDMILVADGLYTGPGNRNVRCEAQELRIRSENGPQHCIIDCNLAEDEHPNAAFVVGPGSGGLFLEGLSIRRAQCAVIAEGADVSIMNCRVTDCGSGCRAVNSSLTAQACQFEDAGAAVDAYGSDLELLACAVAHSSHIWCRYTSVSVKNTAIQQNAYGIRLFDCSAILEGCVISGNGRSQSYQPNSPIHYQDTALYINQCTIVGNAGPSIPNWASAYERWSALHIVNSVLWDNRNLANMLRGECRLTFCDVQDGWQGTGNMDVDPRFSWPGHWSTNGTPDNPHDDFWVEGGYHLKSQAGRWDPVGARWVIDDVTSPCIDAGDPNSPVGDEPEPNGGRINMGAYGGTPQASKSHAAE